MAFTKTTALVSPTSGTDDGGHRAVSNSLSKIASDLSGLNQNVRQIQEGRGKKQAIEDFQNNSDTTPAGTAVQVDGRDEGIFDMFGAREKSYENTIKFLTVARSKQDGANIFDEISTQTTANPSQYEQLGRQAIKGYLEGVPTEARRAVEGELNVLFDKGLKARTKERRDHDVKEANSAAVSIAQTSARTMEALIREHGLAATSMPEFVEAQDEYRNVRDIQENSLDIIYSSAERAADDEDLQRRLVAAGASSTIRSAYDEFAKTVEAQRLEGVSEENLISAKDQSLLAAEDLLSQLGLTADEEAALRTTLKKDIDALSGRDDLLSQQRQDEEERVAAAVTADASVAASRGQLTYAEIDALRGQIGDSKWAELTKVRDRHLEAEKKKLEAKKDISALRAGITVFDPFNKKQAKIMDDYFESEMLPELLQGNAPENGVIDHIAKTGHFPSVIKSMISGKIINGDPSQKLAGVEFADQIRGANPDAYSKLPKRVRDIVEYAVTAQDGGVTGPMALERAFNAVNPDGPEREFRKKKLTSKFMNANLQGVYDLFSGDEDVPLLTDAMMVEADFLFRDEFLNAGDSMGIEVVQAKVAERLKKTWGVSNLGASPGQTMRLPPEKIFGVPGLGDEANSAWIKEQLGRQINEQIGHRLDEFGVNFSEPTRKSKKASGADKNDVRKFQWTDNPIASSAFLVSDNRTFREGSAESAPTYSVAYRDEDGEAQILIVDGAPVRFQPEWATSRQAQIMAKKKEMYEAKNIAKGRQKRYDLLNAPSLAKQVEELKASGGAASDDLYGAPFDPDLEEL